MHTVNAPLHVLYDRKEQEKEDYVKGFFRQCFNYTRMNFRVPPDLWLVCFVPIWLLNRYSCLFFFVGRLRSQGSLVRNDSEGVAYPEKNNNGASLACVATLFPSSSVVNMPDFRKHPV